MDENFKKKYGEYEGVDTNTFKHIPEISCYNNNYYIGLKRKGCATNDLLLAQSDDDNNIEYYHIDGLVTTYIGYEFTNEGIFSLDESVD